MTDQSNDFTKVQLHKATNSLGLLIGAQITQRLAQHRGQATYAASLELSTKGRQSSQLCMRSLAVLLCNHGDKAL